MNIGDRIREKRCELNFSQTELANKIGTTKQNIYKYENGIITNIPSDKIEQLAIALQTTPAYLMGWNLPKKKGIKIPVLGKVQAGIPVEAIEDIIDYEEIDEETAHSGDFFGLQVCGHSMEPRFTPGDVVIVRKQPDVETGQIAIVLVNGEEATIKKISKHKDGISLIPLNPAFEPLFYNNQEIEQLPVTIIGRVIELRAKF